MIHGFPILRLQFLNHTDIVQKTIQNKLCTLKYLVSLMPFPRECTEKGVSFCSMHQTFRGSKAHLLLVESLMYIAAVQHAIASRVRCFMFGISKLLVTTDYFTGQSKIA